MIAVVSLAAKNCLYYPPAAGMAELVDALDSKSSEGNLMRVRVSLPAPEFHTNFTERTCVCTSICMLLACAGCPCATCLPATHRQARRECRRRQDPETTHVGDLCVLCASAFSRSPVPDAIYRGNRSCVALPRQLGNCSRRYPTSATAPCVALAPASLQSSYFPVVVLPALPYLLPPCSRPASLQSSCFPAAKDHSGCERSA